MASQSKNSDGANSKAYEEKRKEVERLLKEGTDEKLQKANTKKALETIEKAHKMAQELEPPWPQVAAYRLAHLLFRDPNADLVRVRDLFREAICGNHLGPMPKIYELAVLHRMQSKQEDIEACFEGAIHLMRHFAHDERSESVMKEGCYRTAIQDCAVNLVELSAYFLGLSHDEILGLTPEGSSSVFAGLGLGKSSWKLVGREPDLAKISYPRAMAEAELEALGKKHGAVLVKFSADERSAEWKFVGNKKYSSVKSKGFTLKTLREVLAKRRSRVALEDKKRTQITRLRNELRKQLKCNIDPIPRGETTLHEEICMYMMVPFSPERDE